MKRRDSNAFKLVLWLMGGLLAMSLWQPALAVPAKFDFNQPGIVVEDACAKREDPENSSCGLAVLVSSDWIQLRASASADGTGWFVVCCWDGSVHYTFSLSVPYNYQRRGFIDFSLPTPRATFPVTTLEFLVSYSAYVGVDSNPLETKSAATAGPVIVGGTELTQTRYTDIHESCHGGNDSDVDWECDWGGEILYTPPVTTLAAPTWGAPEVGDMIRLLDELCEAGPPDQAWDCVPGQRIFIESRHPDPADLPLISVDGSLSAGSYGRVMGDNGGEALACLGLSSPILDWVSCKSTPLLIVARLVTTGEVSFPVRDLGQSTFLVLASGDAPPIPEPTTVALLGIGLATLWLARRPGTRPWQRMR